MRTDPDYVYTYVVSGEAWYADSARPFPGVMVQRAHRGGGVAWEFRIDEHDLSGPTLQIHMFGDSWVAFADAPELFDGLRTQVPATITELRTLLNDLGFVDVTERVRDRPVRLPERA